MRYTSDGQRRYAFRNWLREQLVALDFYQRRGDRYLVSEFARYANSLGARVEEVSLGRYLRDDNPVLPTPESCRELAKALDKHPTEVLLEAGYLSPEDFYFLPSVGVTRDSLTAQIQAIDDYTYLPEAIRAQMKRSLAVRMSQIPAVVDAPQLPATQPATSPVADPITQDHNEIKVERPQSSTETSQQHQFKSSVTK